MAYNETYINLVFEVDCFISSFLSDRLFQVKIGSTLSDFHVQENGVPQGSILSPVLFCTFYYSESSSFVGDFAFCLRGRSLPSVIRWLQLCVNSEQKGSRKWF